MPPCLSEAPLNNRVCALRYSMDRQLYRLPTRSWKKPQSLYATWTIKEREEKKEQNGRDKRNDHPRLQNQPLEEKAPKLFFSITQVANKTFGALFLSFFSLESHGAPLSLRKKSNWLISQLLSIQECRCTAQVTIIYLVYIITVGNNRDCHQKQPKLVSSRWAPSTVRISTYNQQSHPPWKAPITTREGGKMAF